MSGLTGNNILAGSSGQGGYEIEQSLRFNYADSAYLSRTPASTGNRKTYSHSFWAKRSDLPITQFQWVFSVRESTSSGSLFYDGLFYGDDTFSVQLRDGSTNTVGNIRTNQVFRDPSAWYHFFIVIDTTQATSSNRMKLYINGLQVTSLQTATYPSQNFDTGANVSGYPFYYGNSVTSPVNSLYNYSGYLAEVHFIDGQVLTPSDFGETDLLTNQWIPKKYVGTYGTNGFYLNFSDSASLGADSSGNGNNWTPNNLAATDQVLDSPTNNFATLNPLLKTTTDPTMSEGNLKVVTASSGGCARLGTIVPSSGKWYAEFLVNSGSNCTFGVQDPTKNIQDLSSQLPIGSGSYAYYQANGYLYTNGTTQAQTGGATYTTGDIIGITLNLDDNEAKWYKNNTLVYTQALTSGQDLTFAGSDFSNSTSSTFSANFGQDSSFAGIKTAQNNTDANGIGDFYYAPPSGGYLALCENNLPDPSIADPTAQFNTVLYTGNGSSTQAITGVGFQPDFLWLKSRSAVENHMLADVVRGSTKRLISNATNAEDSNGVNSFDSDGFTTLTGGVWNTSSRTYAAWNWKADNTSGSSNTDGTITSTVSANTTAGFSIVKFVNASGTNQETVGHGLNQAPDLIISKNRDTSANNWAVFHSSVCDTTSKFIQLNTSNAITTYSTVWGASLPTASVFGVTGGGIAVASANVIAYCFHSVEGYSKFGSYTGNGSADGAFVYTGFRPAFVITKVINFTANWIVVDNERSPYNLVDKFLAPNTTDVEWTSNARCDFVSNGFKLRTTSDANNGSYNYIYMAFAESPFKYSNAR